LLLCVLGSTNSASLQTPLILCFKSAVCPARTLEALGYNLEMRPFFFCDQGMVAKGCDLLVHVLPFFSSPWLSPLFSVIASSLPLLLPFFFFINFQFRFNLVVGSLLSPLYLCNTPSKSVMYWLGREMKKHLYLLEIDQAKMVTNKSW